MTEEESNQILAEVDADHSGQVDFDEFKLYWVKAKQAGPGEPDFSRPKLSRLEAAEDQSVAGTAEGNKIFGGMDLASDEFRLKIDKLAAQARKMQQVYASSGARV